MGTINSAFSLTSGALDADQAALSVVANNVANANTTGYTEETPDWQENAPIKIEWDFDWRGGDRDRRNLATRPGAGGAAGPAAATGIGIEHAAGGAEQHAGAVYAGFRFVEFDRGRYRQRHHQFLRFLFVA